MDLEQIITSRVIGFNKTVIKDPKKAVKEFYLGILRDTKLIKKPFFSKESIQLDFEHTHQMIDAIFIGTIKLFNNLKEQQWTTQPMNDIEHLMAYLGTTSDILSKDTESIITQKNHVARVCKTSRYKSTDPIVNSMMILFAVAIFLEGNFDQCYTASFQASTAQFIVECGGGMDLDN